MTIRVAVNHRTVYRYDRRVSLSPHLVRLRPAPHCRTSILAYSLRVEPREHFINWQQDPFGNWVARYVFPGQTTELVVQVDLVADMTVVNPFDFFVEDSAAQYPFRYEASLARDLAPYLEVKEDGPLLRAWLVELQKEAPRGTVDFLVALSQRLSKDVDYVIRLESGIQRCEETLERRLGSCRDSAWLLVQMLRQLGLAARFASGYLIQLAADVESLDGPSGPREDFTDLHAWAEVFLPGAGWIGMDATSGLFAGEGHIPLACTPDPSSAAAVSGYTDHCETEFYFHNEVTRVHEDPRVTRPFTEADWQSIDALGEAVDAQLRDDDLRLTMGGEPTFVSVDDMDGEQWSTAALGDDKRRLAGELLLRLRKRFAPGALLHYGQGKWYPGEALPRWALGCFWRTDGAPLWREPRWLASDDTDGGADASTALRFGKHLSAALGLPAARLVPGYEDAFHHLWREGQLPVNVSVLDSRLHDPLERERLARLFSAGLDAVVGYALPLKANPLPGEGPAWLSSAWPFRLGRMHLVPGDSPMGLRLPLDALPWEVPEGRPLEPAPDPFAPLAPLPAPGASAPAARPSASGAGADGPTTDAEEVVHTALCVQARDGRLHVFMPPLKRLEDYVALIEAVEATARATATPVVIEGYEPPRDARLQVLQITPDPGVIEVNVQPASSWAELREIIETLYAEARLTRLGTEKFMLDGRHSGTGGGNHVTLGGPSAADSPLLRRPALLGSLITYWQHHPALSYLFSGAFIGPTSQAPRVDEARDDNLHELEIALGQLPEGTVESPWLVDRCLRNLLVDLTGNTHRAEFCIDKLYSPDGPAGRRGLLEFRAFEMPPHAHMSLLQMLLLRALVARFWREPLRGRLVRWGTELHDRFMLPHFINQDLEHVVDDLREAGYAFEHRWFAPFLEFRFPVFGRVTVDGAEIELRWALEPWHVLGEEMGSGGTARYVDSSVERLQVKVRGLLAQRHALACNGRLLPLYPTGVRGEYVAGVRYKAWQPHSALHPTIKAHVPLVFDVVDINAQRSLGGCTYHVGHPAGRNYDAFPVNASEAEARRVARFWPYGHTPGPIKLDEAAPSADFPLTLDLRHRGRNGGSGWTR